MTRRDFFGKVVMALGAVAAAPHILAPRVESGWYRYEMYAIPYDDAVFMKTIEDVAAYAEKHYGDMDENWNYR